MLVAPDASDWTRLVTLARASVVGAAADFVSGVRLGDLYAFANAAASITNGAVEYCGSRWAGCSAIPPCPASPLTSCRRVTTLSLEEIHGSGVRRRLQGRL